MPGTVYHIFNTANGKPYVGQTWMALDERWYYHQRPGRMLIQRAIKKHGPAAFVVTPLVMGLETQAEMDAAEDAFILELDSLHPNGYNLKRGGSHGRFSDESRRRLSESHKGQAPNSGSFQKGMTPWNKGETASEESRKKMAAAKLGKPRSEAARKAVSDGMKLKRAPQMMKPVICLNDGRRFMSAQEASLFYGLPKTAAARVARGERRHAKGLRFTFSD